MSIAEYLEEQFENGFSSLQICSICGRTTDEWSFDGQKFMCFDCEDKMEDDENVGSC